MKTCRCCGIEKDLSEYFIVKCVQKGVCYLHRLNKCKECLKEYKRNEYKKKKIERYNKIIQKEELKKEEVNMKELKYLLRKIELRGGNIDDIDVYQLTHHYISVYGEYRRQFPNIQSEVLFYYNELLKIK